MWSPRDFPGARTHVSASGQFALSMSPTETRSCAGSLNYRAHPEGRRAMDKRARPAQASTAVGCVVRMLRDGVRVRSDCGAVVWRICCKRTRRTAAFR